MSKKFLAKLLIFCMIFTMLPVSAFGAETKAAETHVYTIGADVAPTSVAVGGTAKITLVAYTVDEDTATHDITKLDGTPSVDWIVKTGSTGAVTVDGNTVTATKAGDVTLAGTVTGVNVPDGTTVVVKEVTLTVTAGTTTVDKAALTTAITEANAAMTDVTASDVTDPAQIEKGKKVAPKTAIDALIAAIATAQGVVDNAKATQDEVNAAVTTLNAAVTTFEGKVVTGTKVETSATEYTVEINSTNDVRVLTGSTKTATLTAVLRENDTIKEIAQINEDAALTWSVEPKDVVTLSANGRKATVTANEVKEETEVVVTAVLTAPETKEVKDKDGNVTVEVVKDEKGNTVMKELASASFVMYVDPTTYTIAMKENTVMELLVNGNDAEKTKAMAVVVKADDKEVTNLPVSWASSNTEVAIVDAQGNVTAVGYGNATITATITGTSVKATRTVKAAYKPVTVTFNAGEGKFADDVADKDGVVKLTTNEQGKLSKLAAAPTREEYKFMGWAFAGQSTPVTTDKVYDQDTELQAIWVKIEPLKAVATTSPDGTTQIVKVTGTFNGSDTKTEGAASASNTTATFNVVTKIGDNIDDSITNVEVAIDPTTAATLKDAKTVNFITNVATITLGDVAVQDLADAGFVAGASENVMLTAFKKAKDNNGVTNTALKEKIKATYDFALKLNGANVINNAKANITVQFAAPDDIENTVFVYFVNKGALKDMHAELRGRNVVMTTNHFSEYVVAAEKLVYNVTFKAGKGGEGADEVRDVQITPNDKDGNKVPTEYTLPKVAELGFHKTGATFDHWSNGGNEYADGATIKVSGDMTLTAVWKDDKTGDVISNGTGGVGGGGGGSSSNVSVATNVTGGKVTVSPSRPVRGQTVTLTAKPADGYKLDTLTVTDNKGNVIELTKIDDNKYTFTMPAGKITVTPAFVKVDGADKKDEEKPGTNVSKRFSDVASDAWYAEYINYVAENGLMNGYENGTFGPNDKTTRAQIVTVLYRMEGEPAVQNSNSFKDVSAGGQYYSSAVAWAARDNIVNGYEDGRFGPNDNVTREQIAAILFRYAEYKGYDTTLAGNIASFNDAAKVSAWATKAIGWAVGEGLMNGDNGALRPQGNATRAEIAALLMRFSENIAK